VSDYFLQSFAVALGLFVGVFTVMAAPYVMAFAAAYRALASRFGPVALPMLAGAAWTASELGRGRLFTGTPFFVGNPWALAGYSQVGFPAFVQIASVTGIYGVSFGLVAVNAEWRSSGPRGGQRSGLRAAGRRCRPSAARWRTVAALPRGRNAPRGRSRSRRPTSHRRAGSDLYGETSTLPPPHGTAE
jgi:hypothetical protein